MPQLTNSLRKLVYSLSESKHRRTHGLFVAEGTKCIADTAGHFVGRYLFADRAWLADHADIVGHFAADSVYEASANDLERMSHMSTAPKAIAVYETPADTELSPAALADSLVMALDCIQDPGNLGTIVRLCDWMGITTILASHDTADIWAPKVVQASMGAISRVRVVYCDLPAVLASWPAPVYGTFLDAPDIYRAPLSPNGVIVMGNEGRGISPSVAAAVTRRLFIPSFPHERSTSESLNVATAAAITVAEFRSRQLKSRN